MFVYVEESSTFASVINNKPINGYKNSCYEARRNSILIAY